MFPKECFTGQDKKLAKSHWAEFSKYLDYQNQQGTLLRDLAHLPEIKSMFKLTLQDIALGWFETESPTWLTEDQMKQSFLKRFNPWGDTRRQQQDAWNKLKFDMTKDDVDSFVVDTKTLASILGHNDEIIMEKFKDVFPDPNIEAALIAMDDFALMQKKAKQLVHIYKPAHDNPMASATILVHTAENTVEKENRQNLKVISISWPLLINRKHLTIMVQVIIIIMGDNAAEDAAVTEVLVDVEIMPIRTVMTIKNEDLDAAKDNVIQIIVEGVVTIIHTEDEEDSGTEMTRITVTEIIGTEIMMVTVILTGVDDGTIIVEVKDIVIMEEVDDGILVSSIMTQGTTRNPNFQDPNHYRLPPIGHQYRYPIPYGQYPYQSQQQQYSSQMPTPSQQAANICQLCYSQGHYDYQCQFAGDFMARTQKAFNQGRSYSHQDPNNGEWSQGDGDNNDPNGQPFQ